MARLDLDETEYAILVAINTFSSGSPFYYYLLCVLGQCLTVLMLVVKCTYIFYGKIYVMVNVIFISLIYLLLCILDRPHIKDVDKVESMQDPYVELLRLYTKIRHPDVSIFHCSFTFTSMTSFVFQDPLMFARILMKIVELRSLNNYHSEQMFALKVQDQKLPPLLAEIWDM